MKYYMCPVCGFAMDQPPKDYAICPCCGTEFGYHTAGRTPEEIRQAWIRAGAEWWSPVDPRPINWDPFTQLLRAGLNVRVTASTSQTSRSVVIATLVPYVSGSARNWWAA